MCSEHHGEGVLGCAGCGSGPNGVKSERTGRDIPWWGQGPTEWLPNRGRDAYTWDGDLRLMEISGCVSWFHRMGLTGKSA